ncbi:MAG TPA: hypothetical protein DCS60_01100, partial [Opitutae bacterium]|nr:hypothetical protein [Opitutae bacterium]
LLEMGRIFEADQIIDRIKWLYHSKARASLLFETAPILIPEAFGNSIGEAMPVENSMVHPTQNTTAYQRKIW